MFETILEAIFGSLIKFASSWLAQREAARSAQTAQQKTAQAEAKEGADRDATADQVETDRENTDAQLAKADRDAAGPDGVQHAGEDAAAAIAAANDSVRGA
jgi:hypothetical protein